MPLTDLNPYYSLNEKRNITYDTINELRRSQTVRKEQPLDPDFFHRSLLLFW